MTEASCGGVPRPVLQEFRRRAQGDIVAVAGRFCAQFGVPAWRRYEPAS